ncbi:MAG: RdgB/HAM1 family non-canonical purine NTP pyrophosphatase [Bacilli bacterium]|jgi:XTP/dITP diphosphohydrolase|nr:RdgB/HAM1 family non-canonical purine NTP pyrophosphatase [Erysipelotrichia bacterium]
MQILVATNNKHKLNEYRFLFKNTKIEVLSLKDLDIKNDVIENGKTYIENAILKAQGIASLTNLIVLADDSGLEISALKKFPGLLSSRFAAQFNKQEDANFELLKKLKGKRNRRAKFKISIAIANLEKDIITFNDFAKGEICYEERGGDGFGYDPIFFHRPYQKTFAELTLKEKSTLSHRGKAIKQFIAFLERKKII